MRWSDIEIQLTRRGLDQGQSREIIWTALRQKALRVATSASMVEDQDLEGTIPDELIMTSVLHTLHEGPVSTLPISGPAGGSVSTVFAFEQIIALACRELLISSPYLDDEGVKKLQHPIREAAKRGVNICLLTRETDKRQPSRTRGLAMLIDLAGSQLSVRDYHTQLSGQSHYTSVHAKLLLADRRLGYIGSAEIRGNALQKNFEIGFILTHHHAAFAGQTFDSVWKVAKPATMPLRER